MIYIAQALKKDYSLIFLIKVQIVHESRSELLSCASL
jgi:hypothetical protein